VRRDNRRKVCSDIVRQATDWGLGRGRDTYSMGLSNTLQYLPEGGSQQSFMRNQKKAFRKTNVEKRKGRGREDWFEIKPVGRKTGYANHPWEGGAQKGKNSG